MLSTIVLCILFLWFGFYFRDLRDRLSKLSNKLNDTKPAKKPIEGPKTTFAEPMTPLELAAIEERERIRKLNE